MTAPNYVVGTYRDLYTRRWRIAVLCRASRCWYFPRNYGYRAAQALANRMNRSS